MLPFLTTKDWIQPQLASKGYDRQGLSKSPYVMNRDDHNFWARGKCLQCVVVESRSNLGSFWVGDLRESKHGKNWDDEK